jgi:aryl carrier-like protein
VADEDDPDVTRELICFGLTPIEVMRLREGLRRARIQEGKKTDATALMVLLAWAHEYARKKYPP